MSAFEAHPSTCMDGMDAPTARMEWRLPAKRQPLGASCKGRTGAGQ